MTDKFQNNNYKNMHIINLLIIKLNKLFIKQVIKMFFFNISFLKDKNLCVGSKFACCQESTMFQYFQINELWIDKLRNRSKTVLDWILKNFLKIF